MTAKEVIAVMTASRELDCLIATRVMGWADVRLEDAGTPKVDVVEYAGVPPGCSRRFGVWHFSTSMNDAWCVFEELRKRFTNVVLAADNGFGLTAFDVGRDGITRRSVGPLNAATAPLAICRTALLAEDQGLLALRGKP